MNMGFNRAVVALICSAAALCVGACDNSASQTVASVQESHVAGNTPAGDEFETLLLRDLGAYFASQGMPGRQIKYELLRREPTQSGVAYPKYYLWVSAVSTSGDMMVGAVRVAAIDRVRFEVTNYVPKQEVLANPDVVASIFPAALLSAIHAKAAAP